MRCTIPWSNCGISATVFIETGALELASATGIDPEFRSCGGVYLGRTVGEKLALQAAVAQWREDGVRIETWSVAELQRHEPALSELNAATQAYFLPDEVQVRPSRILRALQTRLEQLGGTLRRVDHLGWDLSDRAAPALKTADGSLRARHYCLTTGPWATELLAPWGLQLPVEPRRGQILMWQLPSPVIRHVVNEGPRYLVSRSDGHLLVGSTVEEVGFQGDPTPEGVAELTRFARELVPALRSVEPSASWAGLRPWSSDGLPYLGSVPGNPQISLATGHFRSGIHLAPATARLMRQLICGEPLDLSLTPFSPAR